jgi:hypothetical protein
MDRAAHLGVSIGRRGFVSSVTTLAFAGCASAPDERFEVPGRGKRWPESSLRTGSRQRDPASPGEALMRQHGMIGRVLLVYEETARRLADEGASLELPFRPDAGFVTVSGVVRSAAHLIRTVVEEHHEAAEERLVFARLKEAGRSTRLVDALLDQHRRGRALTDAILRRVEESRAGEHDAALAALLRDYSRLSRAHAAREDMLLMPSFKATLDGVAYRDVAYELTHERPFSDDGWPTIEADIGAMEAALGMIGADA